MNPQTILDQLCERHGVDPEQAARLLPLVTWALKGPEDSRKRILSVVERTLAGDGDCAQERQDELNAAADHAVLVAVGRILHDWTPTDSFLGVDLSALGGQDEAEGELET